MNKPAYQATLDGMAKEFQADTIVRLEFINEILTEFQVNESSVRADFARILAEIHSIKGTAKTFGFGGLSHVSHAMNNWMRGVSEDNPLNINVYDPALGDDLKTFLSLMLSITRAKDRQSDQQGIDAMSETSFTLYPGGA